MRIGNISQLESSRQEYPLDSAANFHPVLQGAGGMKGELSRFTTCASTIGSSVEKRLKRPDFGLDDFTDIPRHFGDSCRLFRICRIVPQQMAVFLDSHAAAA